MTKNVNAGIRAVGKVLVDSCTVETNSQNGPSIGVDMDGTDGYVVLTHTDITGPGAGMNHGIYSRGHAKVEDCTVTDTGTTLSFTGITHRDGDLTLNRCIIDMTGGEGVVLGDQLDATDVTMNYCNITLENGTGVDFWSGTMTGSHNVVTLEGYDSDNEGIAAGASDGVMFHIGGFLIKTPPYGYNGVGVTIYDDSVTLDHITVDGFGTGFWDAFPEEENTVENCIASTYYDAGFEDVAAAYCIADGSGPYDYRGGSTDATDLTEDPLYCDRASNEYDLRVDSYGNPENNGSGEIIGAYGVGCMYGTLARTSSFTIDSGTATLRMTGAVTVPQGDTLTLGGHLDVPVSKASPEAKLTVNGRLQAVGASGAYGLMTFRSAETSPAAGD